MSRLLKTGDIQITQKYSSKHLAVDIVKYKSQLDTVLAHSSGKITFCQTGQKNNPGSTGNKSYGNCVKIDHGNGYETLYAHLDKVYVKLGQNVSKGQEIGYMGNTGNSNGAHEHFEVRKDGKRIDPTPYLNADLPNAKKEITCEYRAWGNTSNKWLKKVKDGESAGNGQETIGGIQLITNGGGVTKLIAHTLGYPKNKWNKEVVDGAFGPKDDDYAGIKGLPIDAISGWSEFGDLAIQVKTKERGWLPVVVGKYGTSDTNDYAGNIGEAIIDVRVKIV